ncbi:hypothetical protein DFJ77DRAFT_477459 [Powellomyces hirtus]|nr:hypothetical protein DFJ77DRAFT_477459 [Powellomyces hirtus]
MGKRDEEAKKVNGNDEGPAQDEPEKKRFSFFGKGKGKKSSPTSQEQSGSLPRSISEDQRQWEDDQQYRQQQQPRQNDRFPPAGRGAVFDPDQPIKRHNDFAVPEFDDDAPPPPRPQPAAAPVIDDPDSEHRGHQGPQSGERARSPPRVARGISKEPAGVYEEPINGGIVDHGPVEDVPIKPHHPVRKQSKDPASKSDDMPQSALVREDPPKRVKPAVRGRSKGPTETVRPPWDDKQNRKQVPAGDFPGTGLEKLPPPLDENAAEKQPNRKPAHAGMTIRPAVVSLSQTLHPSRPEDDQQLKEQEVPPHQEGASNEKPAQPVVKLPKHLQKRLEQSKRKDEQRQEDPNHPPHQRQPMQKSNAGEGGENPPSHEIAEADRIPHTAKPPPEHHVATGPAQRERVPLHLKQTQASAAHFQQQQEQHPPTQQQRPRSRTIRPKSSAHRRRVLFGGKDTANTGSTTRIPVPKKPPRNVNKQPFHAGKALATLDVLARTHNASRNNLARAAPKPLSPLDTTLDPELQPDEKIAVLTTRLRDQHTHLAAVFDERASMAQQLRELKRRLLREQEKSNVLPKVTTVVPTSVEANLNLRYQFKKHMDAERERYHKLEEENKLLAMRVKELEARQQATKRSPSSATNLRRQNDVIVLQKKLKEYELEKHRLSDQIHKQNLQLKREQDAKSKIEIEKQNLRTQFVHTLRGLDPTLDAPAAMDETNDAAAAASADGSGRAKTGGVQAKVRRRLSSVVSVVKSSARASAGRVAKNGKAEGKPTKPKPIATTDIDPAHPEHPPTNDNLDSGTRPDGRDGRENPPGDDIRSPGDADGSKNSKGNRTLPNVFRKPDRHRSVLANLDRDLREAGNLIDSLDQDLVRAASERRNRTGRNSSVPASDVEDDSHHPMSNAIQQQQMRAERGRVEEESRQPRGRMEEEHRPGGPGANNFADMDSGELTPSAEENPDKRMRSAKIRVEYDVWVKNKQKVAAERAQQQQQPPPLPVPPGNGGR